MKQYVCSICGYTYDEAKGIPEKGIAPNTTWEALPADWKCPLCGAPKSEFKEKSAQPTPQTNAPIERLAFEHELSPMEMSIICSNLVQGSVKQYMPEQAESFRKLADFFKAQALPEDSFDATALLAFMQQDLELGFPAGNAAAKEVSDRGALRCQVWSEKVTRIQKSLLERYNTEGGAMLADTNVHVCSVCGFISVGTDAPDLCPVCKVPAWKFETMERGNR